MLCLWATPSLANDRNVVFLISDDLSAEALRSYGNLEARTPNLDRLAARGMVFDRAYCQYPVCTASRASLMTGLYPTRLQAQGINGSWSNVESAIGDHPSMAEHFKNSGYVSSRVSKIYHMRVPGDITNGVAGPDHAPSWTRTFNVQAPEWMTPGVAGHYTNESLNFTQPTAHYNLGFGAAFYAVASSTNGAEQADWIAADQAISELGVLHRDPFFLALGLVRPHVPLVAPDTTFALFDPTQLALAESVPNDLADIPPIGVFWNEPARGPNSDTDRRLVLQAYYASVTFMDEQVGRVLDELDQLGLTDETYVVFTSDHGYHLGEHTMWQKLSVHEESARVPLMIAGPGIQPGRTDALVELVDLYPTLADLCGLSIPAPCQGASLRGVLEGTATTVRDAAFSMVSNGQLLRTEDWAYLRYSNGAEELYDMRPAPVGDPLQFTNLAGDPVQAPLLTQLRAGLDAQLASFLADPGALFCPGDGTQAFCPCFNNGLPGAGCLNTSGLGARLAGGGIASSALDSFRLTVTGGPPGRPGILVQGVPQPPAPAGAGLLCTSFQLRHPLQVLDASGSVTYANLAFAAMQGQTLHYQFAYRDAPVCGQTFNFTSGWQVTWQ